jgi:hypothetical protein
MSDTGLIRFYSVVFTDGSALRRTHVEANNVADARARAANIALGMMDQHEPGTQDWSAWHVIIDTPDEGCWDDPFPSGLPSGPNQVNKRLLDSRPSFRDDHRPRSA